MKKAISMFLAVLTLLSVITVPAFAADEIKANDCIYGREWQKVPYVTSVDSKGNGINVSGGPTNNKTFPLSEAPEMDYMFTINNITFSNYIKHRVREVEDKDGNPITVYQIYIGQNGAMRSNVDNMEFAMELMAGRLDGWTSDFPSDGESIKTNTAGKRKQSEWNYYYMDWYYIRPYTNGGRNMDGTWQKGLTWVFEVELGGNYSETPRMEDYKIRVNDNGTLYNYQVFVSNDTNYTGERAGKTPEVTPPVETPTTPPVTPPVVETPTVTPAKVATANPTTSKIYINGREVAFDAYNINNNNYFKLRDVALSIRGTEKQFEVAWNPSFTETVNGENIRGCIEMVSNKAYTVVGGEMQLGDGVAKTANLTTSPILKDGERVTNLVGYNIKGNNYFKLRDLGILFDFDVTWDGARNAIVIDTTKSYTPD